MFTLRRDWNFAVLRSKCFRGRMTHLNSPRSQHVTSDCGNANWFLGGTSSYPENTLIFFSLLFFKLF